VTVLGGPPRDDAAFWRAVALVADEPTWYPGLSLHEHLELVRLTHEPVQGWCLPTDELIEVFGLAGRADAVPTDLSSGQRQRLSLAAALARPSRLLLLDEPEQSLDPGFRKELAGLAAPVRRARRDGGHGHPRPRLCRGRRGAADADLRGAGGHARGRSRDRVGRYGRSAAGGRDQVVHPQAAAPALVRLVLPPGFAVVLAVILLWDLLAQPFGRLSGSGGAAPTQAVAGAALVIGAAAGLLVLAQALGPLALSPADAAWLLLTPLNRRDVLRPARGGDGGDRGRRGRGARRAGAGHGRALPAAAGRGPGRTGCPWAWLVLSAVGGAGFFAAAMFAGVLAQPWPRWRVRLRAVRRGRRRSGHSRCGGRGTLACRLAGDHRQASRSWIPGRSA
jgi:hypothetical protein